MRGLPAALIGYGRWGRVLARVARAHPALRLAAVVETDPLRAAEAAAALPGAAVVSTLAEALRVAPDVVAALVAAPPPALDALSRSALTAGLHVFVEKPGGAGSEALADAGAVAARAGLTLTVDLTARFGPLQAGLLAAAGRVGRPLGWDSLRANDGARQPGVSVLRDLAIHDLAALEALRAGPPEGLALEDAALAPDGRLGRATLRLDWADGFAARLAADWDAPSRVRVAALRGTRATLWRDEAPGGPGLTLTRPGAPARTLARQAPPGSPGEPLADALGAFAAAVAGTAPNRACAFRAARLLALIEAAEAQAPALVRAPAA